MYRRHRLRSRDRFQQVRREGQAYKHRLMVLVCLPNQLTISRFGFSASRRVGNAVHRNRARRLMREAFRQQLSQVRTGWDIVLIARPAISTATFRDVDRACQSLLMQANLYQQPLPVHKTASSSSA